MITKLIIVAVIICILILASIVVKILHPLSLLRSQEKSLSFEGKERSYLLHLPSNYTTNNSYPLLLALHGLGDFPRQLEINTGLSKKADVENFIVVYPKGIGGDEDKRLSWNAGFCCGTAQKEKSNDVLYIKNVIEEVKKTYNVNAKKIYVVGFSNGGMMAYRLTSDLPNTFAAVATVVASTGGTFEDQPKSTIATPSASVSIIAFNGKQDQVVPYAGGVNKKGDGNFEGAETSIAFWAKNNTCQLQTKKETIENGNVVKESYTGCSNNADVILYTIADGEHAWFGGVQELPKALFQKRFSATDALWEFFKDKSLYDIESHS